MAARMASEVLPTASVIDGDVYGDCFVSAQIDGTRVVETRSRSGRIEARSMRCNGVRESTRRSVVRHSRMLLDPPTN